MRHGLAAASEYPQGQPWPQGQQPYPQYGPPAGQPPYPGPSYPGPGGPPPRRKKRHTIRNVFGGIGALIVVIVIITAAHGGSGDHAVTAVQAASTPSSTPSASRSARIGSAITLAGNSTGEQVAVTVVRVFRHPQPATQFDAPDAGDRLYAVQFRLTDTGSAAYSDSPSNGTAVVDASGQSYESSSDDAAGCDSFPGTENIAAGSSGLGCVVFEVPKAAVITEVQFTLDSGMGPQTGQWDLRS
jgi:Domain of unknown function (DUF4352)